MKAYKATIDELTDDYNATLGYIENLKAVPKGEEPKDFSGGVNDDEATTEPAKEADEVPTVPNAPEFNGGANPADAPAAEVSPEFNGGVNAVEAAVNEVPEFKGGVSDGDAPTQPTNPEFNGGVNDITPPTEPNKPEGEAPKPSKPETSNGDALVQPELPEFTGGVNDGDAPTQPTNPEFNGGVNDNNTPTQPTNPEFNGGVSDADAPTQPTNPEFNGGVNDTTPPTEPNKPEGDAPKPSKPEASNGDALVQPELPKFNGGVNDGDAPTQPTNPEFNGGVNDTTPPTEPNKPDGDAPKPPKTEASVEKAKGPKDEIKRLESEIAKLESDLKDAENNGAEDYFKEGLQKALDNTKQELKEILVAWLNNVTEVPELKVTRYINTDNHDISEAAEGTLKAKDIAGYEFVNTTVQDGITTHIYKVKLNETQPTPDSGQGGAGPQGATHTEGQAASPAVGQKAKPTSKEGRILPNTGVNSSSTAALGLSLIALVGVAVRRKLSK